MIQRQTVQFAFGSVRQDRGSKHLQVGDLVEAINVRQTDAGPYTKRRGWDRVTTTFSGASFTAPAESLVAGDGGSLLMRDAAGRAWALDPDTNAFLDRGRLQRGIIPDAEAAMPVQLANPRTRMVAAGDDLWIFAIGGGVYYRTVIDRSSGVVKLAQTSQTAANITSLAAAYDGTNVWVFWIDGSSGITAHKFTPATPATAPVSTAYRTSSMSNLHNITARRFSAISETAVVATSAGGYEHSYLDPATGMARVSPAPVVTAITSFGSGILIHDGSGGSWYYALYVDVGTTSPKLRLVTVNSTTLAVSVVTLATEAQTDVAEFFGIAMGYVATNGDRVVFAQFDPLDGGDLRPDNYTVTRYTYDGVSTVALVVARGAWIASDPVTHGGTVFFMTGYDDVAVAPVTVPGLQRTLHLRNNSGEIVAQILYGEGSASYHRAAPAFGAGPANYMRHGTATALLSFTAGTEQIVMAGAMQTNSTELVSPSKIVIDMARAVGMPVAFRGRAIAPGAIPIVWSAKDRIHEIAPLLFPSYIRRSAGAGTGNTALAAVYVITDSDGTLWRSAPVLVTGTFGANDTVAVPTLRALLPGTSVDIEIYIGSATPQLQGTVANDPTVDEVTFIIPSTIVNGETLYTTGGAVSNSPAPAAVYATIWRNRLFLASGQDVWYSLETAPGFGPRLNEVLITELTDGSGDVLGIGSIDWNYLAVFKRDAVIALSGPGPDGRGAGNYVPQTLTTKMGCTNVASLVSGPAGCYFRDAATGRLAIAPPALAVSEVAGGADSYASEAITAAVHAEDERHVRFWTASRIIVIDYRHPTETAPAGQVYSWEGSALIPSGGIGGVTADAAGVVAIEATLAATRRPGTGFQDTGPGGVASYAMSLLTGHLQPSGLQGEIAVSRIVFLGRFRAGHTVALTTFPDYAAAGTTVLLAFVGEPHQLSTRPPSAGRIQAMQARIAESPASSGQAFDFEALALEFQARGRAKHLGSAQLI